MSSGLHGGRPISAFCRGIRQDGGMPDGPPPGSSPRPYRVTFVCTGNICRSPIARVVVEELIREQGLEDRVELDSAAIGDWHVGEAADPRALAVLTRHGYDGSFHRARQLEPDEISAADLVIAMDRGHADVLRVWARTQQNRAKVRLLRSFDPGAEPHDQDLADPYYGDDDGFRAVLEQVRAAAPGLVEAVREELRRRESRDSA